GNKKGIPNGIPFLYAAPTTAPVSIDQNSSQSSVPLLETGLAGAAGLRCATACTAAGRAMAGAEARTGAATAVDCTVRGAAGAAAAPPAPIRNTLTACARLRA